MDAQTLHQARLRAALPLNRFPAKRERRAKRGATPNCEAHSANAAEQAGAPRLLLQTPITACTARCQRP